MPSKKTTSPIEPSSTAAGSSANKKPETPAAPSSPSVSAKKRTGKGVKAAAKKAASQPSDKAETQAAPETAGAAPEGASSYPFPPPPEALPWEGVGEALPRRKDQLEINRREREKLAELLAAGESQSASGSDAAPLQKEKADAASAPQVPVFLGNSQKKNTPSTAKAEKPATAENRVVSPAKKSPSESNASASSKDSGTPKKPKAQKPTQKADGAQAKKAAKPKTKTKKENRTVKSAAGPQAMACFRKAESPAAEAETPPPEPAPDAASGNESVNDAPIQNAPDAAQTPASPEPTRFSSGRSGVFGASLGRGLQELSNELPQEPSDKASGTTAPTFVDAPGENEAKPAGPDAAPDAPHFIALEGRRKNLDSIEKPHEPMRELFPSGTHELLKEMADPDWKEKFIAESLSLRDQLEEEEASLAIRKAAAAVPLARAEELSRARIECEAVEGERPRLLLTDHPDILAVFPDDAGDAYLALLLREISRLEARAREIANVNPADPRLPRILKAFEEVLEAALPAFQEKVRGIDARMRVLKEAGAAAFLWDIRSSEPFRPDSKAESSLSGLMGALACISRGEFPPSNAKKNPTPTSLWLEALGSVGEPRAEKAPGGDLRPIPREGSPRTSMDSLVALTETRTMPPAPAPDGGPANAPGRSVKSFIFRPASYLGAIASALICAAIVPKLFSAVFPSPAFAVVDNDFVRERVALLRIAHTRPGMPEREDLKALDGDRIDEAIRLVSEAKGLPVLDARDVLSGAVSSGNACDLTDDIFERLGIRPEELRVLDAALKEGWAADLSNLAESGSAAPSLLMQKAREAEANPPMPHSDHDFMDRVKRTLKFFGSSTTESSKGEAP